MVLMIVTYTGIVSHIIARILPKIISFYLQSLSGILCNPIYLQFNDCFCQFFNTGKS